MRQKAFEKYNYLHRLDCVTDFVNLACNVVKADTLDGLMEGALPLLATAPPYLFEEVPKIHEPVVAAAIKPKNRAGVGAHFAAVKKYLSDLADDLDSGKPVVSHFPSMGPEPFLAMGVVPLCAEALTLYLTGSYENGVEEEIDEAEAEGIPNHSCSFQKAPFKAMDKGLLPLPDAFLVTTAPCNSSNMLYQNMMDKHNKPVFVVDSPYYWNKRSFKYFAEEYKQAILGVAKHLGTEIDVATLRKHVEWSNEQYEWWFKLQKLRRIKPNPDPGMHRAFDLAAWLLSGSNELWINYFKVLYEEAKERADNGLGVVPEGMEEIRTLHTYGWTAHTIYLPDWMEDNLGSSMAECGLSIYPGDLIGFVDTTNLDTMLEGLAWRSFNGVMHRTVMTFADLHINDMVSVAKEYQVDAAVFAGNNTCKWGWTYPKMLSDALQENMGIPCLSFETDIMDKRFTPREVTFSMLTEFFNNLRAR
ncbi:2-hydroxyacyl-CoA dehydratase family protein [Dehalobacter sp. DCM]|uniref:2-hydroxyacyl-CoA dehydratase family protein n=1 Tax=Dehalobacter sp. DCM TaxID=2907827 RepID=UPI00308167CC|nr:2-hydroxyacyl-CoA dehydratase family protein [Dehalobacter sp. DCM]